MSRVTFGALLVVATGWAVPAGATDAAPAADGVSALGRVEPENGVILLGVSSQVNAVSGAVLSKLLVEAGQNVKAGQLLAETDTAKLEGAQLEVRKAELELAERESEVASGEEQDVCSRAEVAQRTSTRRNNLRRSGVTSDEETDVAAGEAKALAGSCAAARIATKAAVSRIAVAKAEVGRAEAELERSRVRAPSDGRILRIVCRPGEMAALEGVLEMGNVDRMYVIAEVYETDIGRVHAGQKATVTSTSLPGPQTGVVERVRLQVRKQDVTDTDPAARKDARIVEVEVLLDDPKPVANLTNLQVEVLLHP